MVNNSTRNSERYLYSPEVIKYIGSDEISQANSTGVKVLQKEIPLDSDRLGGVQSIRIGVAKSRQEDPRGTILMPVAWSDSPEHRFQQQRSYLMANLTGSQVLTIGFPGMGGDYDDPHNDLSEKDSEETKKGRLDSLASSTWEALTQDEAQLLKEKDGNYLPIGLWLNSLGTLTGSELLGQMPDGLEVSDVYLSESMALERMKTAVLMSRFILGSSRHFKDYARTNIGAIIGAAEVPLVRQVTHQPRSHYESVRALAGGQQISILKEAITKNSAISQDTLFHVVRASDGLVKPEENERLVVFLKLSLSHQFGVQNPNVRVQTLAGEGYGFQDSLPVLQTLVGDLAINDR